MGTATTTARGLLTPSPRLRPMPLFCTEATATATPLPSPTGATPMLPTPTAPTATASATAATAMPATGNLPHPHYVHIRGHHVRAGCLGVGIQRAARAASSKKIFKQEQDDPAWNVNATESVCPQFPW